jgi:hypothetical protein
VHEERPSLVCRRAHSSEGIHVSWATAAAAAVNTLTGRHRVIRESLRIGGIEYMMPAMDWMRPTGQRRIIDNR